MTTESAMYGTIDVAMSSQVLHGVGREYGSRAIAHSGRLRVGFIAAVVMWFAQASLYPVRVA